MEIAIGVVVGALVVHAALYFGRRSQAKSASAAEVQLDEIIDSANARTLAMMSATLSEPKEVKQ